MSGQIHQLTQLICRVCDTGGVWPREQQQYDRMTQETVTEAIWICPRCNSIINRGEISRVKRNEK